MTSGNLHGQKLFQLYYNIMNPLMMDGEGYPGHSMGFNGLLNKTGFEIDYGNTRKVHDNRYTYVNPQFKFLMDKSEGSEVSKYSYFTLGMMRFTANKNTTFTARGENLVAPYWDTMESARLYNTYRIQAKLKTTALQIGFERVTEKHISVQGLVYYLNPVTWAISIFSEGEVTELKYTRTFRFSVFAAPPGWLKMDILGSKPDGGTEQTLIYPNENKITDPTMKNLVGARLGWVWTSLKPLGSSFGIEMTMLPGIFSVPGVYGRGFPDDNIYIKANYGFSIGNSEKN